MLLLQLHLLIPKIKTNKKNKKEVLLKLKTIIINHLIRYIKKTHLKRKLQNQVVQTK